MYIHKIKIPYHFLSGYSGLDLSSKKIRYLKTFISGPYFEALFWVCVRPTFCVPSLKMARGTKSDDFGVCVSVPSQIFWSVPANGIKRVGAMNFFWWVLGTSGDGAHFSPFQSFFLYF